VKLRSYPRMPAQQARGILPSTHDPNVRHLYPYRVGFQKVDDGRVIHWDNQTRLGKSEHPYCLLQISLAGRGYFQDGRRRQNLPARTGFLVPIPSETSYGLAPGQDWEWIWVGFGGDFAFQLVREINRRGGYRFKFPEGSEVLERVCRLYDQSVMDTLPSNIEVSLELHRILLDIDALAAGYDVEINDAVTLALQQIDLEFRDAEFDLEALARGVSLSKFHFLRQFKRVTGQTPMLALRMRRLREARDLLATSNLSVKEVAYAVGYTSPIAFSAAFKREFGRSPSERVSGRGRNRG